jgi:hypothetical protein
MGARQPMTVDVGTLGLSLNTGPIGRSLLKSRGNSQVKRTQGPSALYMDSPSLADRFCDQMSDAYVYSAFARRRYLLAQYVCALRFL